jgi:hypothetical protein
MNISQPYNLLRGDEVEYSCSLCQMVLKTSKDDYKLLIDFKETHKEFCKGKIEENLV